MRACCCCHHDGRKPHLRLARRPNSYKEFMLLFTTVRHHKLATHLPRFELGTSRLTAACSARLSLRCKLSMEFESISFRFFSLFEAKNPFLVGRGEQTGSPEFASGPSEWQSNILLYGTRTHNPERSRTSVSWFKAKRACLYPTGLQYPYTKSNRIFSVQGRASFRQTLGVFHNSGFSQQQYFPFTSVLQQSYSLNSFSAWSNGRISFPLFLPTK